MTESLTWWGEPICIPLPSDLLSNIKTIISSTLTSHLTAFTKSPRNFFTQHFTTSTYKSPTTSTSHTMCLFSSPKKHHHGHRRYVEEVVYSPRSSRRSYNQGGRSSYTSVTRTTTARSPASQSYSSSRPVHIHHMTSPRRYV